MKYILLLIVFISACNLTAGVIDFDLPDYHNQTFSLIEHLGEKTIVIAFWTSCCLNGVRLLSELEKIHQSNEDIVVISVNVDTPNDLNRGLGFLRSGNYSFYCLIDVERKVYNSYQINYLPQTLVINPDEEIVLTLSGYNKGDEKKIIEAINSIK